MPRTPQSSKPNTGLHVWLQLAQKHVALVFTLIVKLHWQKASGECFTAQQLPNVFVY